MGGINSEFTDIMIDLETLGTVPGCAIVSIGAVAFNEFRLHDIGFYRAIAIKDWDTPGETEDGLHKDADTIDWWKKQSPAALAVFHAAPSFTTNKALQELARYCNEFGSPRVWGNGADFDNPIIAVAARKVGLSASLWKPYNGRCYRTVKNGFKDIKLKRVGTYHNALDDARSQAQHLVDICQNRGWRLA